MDADSILFVLSAKARMSWAAFREACTVLASRSQNMEPAGSVARNAMQQRPNALPWLTLRGLAALGHCDYHFPDRGGGEVVVAPATIVRLPSPIRPLAVLAGQRHPSTVGQLCSLAEALGCHVNITRHSQPVWYLPDRVMLEADTDAALADLARESGYRYSGYTVSRAILRFARDVPTVIGECETFGEGIPPSAEGFDADELVFVPWTIGDGQPALSRLRRPTGRYCHVLRTSRRTALVDRDYGCYAALQALGKQVLLYDTRNAVLMVRKGAWLPVLFERAVVLASGAVGRGCPIAWPGVGASESIWAFAYSGVPADVAEVLVRKLGQTLSEHRTPDGAVQGGEHD